MTDQELLDLARDQLEDTVEPYLWSTAYILIYRNKAVDEVCRRLKQITDSTTLSICHIDLLSGSPTYTTSQKIVEITSARLDDEGTTLTRKDSAYMDAYSPTWRDSEGTPSIYIPEYEQNTLRVYPYYDDVNSLTGSSNITFTLATSTISKASGLSVLDLVADDEINITGTTSNNGTFTITSASDTAIVTDEALVNENNTSAVIRKVMDTLSLSVVRLPLTWVTIADLTGTPPLDEEYHFDLVDGIKKYAYLKRDAETYNPKAAAEHTILFEKSIIKMVRSRIGKTSFPQTIGPHPGTI